MNKIILYIATSLDGFIADINGGVDWLPHTKDEAELEAVGYKKFNVPYRYYFDGEHKLQTNFKLW